MLNDVKRQRVRQQDAVEDYQWLLQMASSSELKDQALLSTKLRQSDIRSQRTSVITDGVRFFGALTFPSF